MNCYNYENLVKYAGSDKVTPFYRYVLRYHRKHYENKPILLPTYSSFKELYLTGNRLHFQFQQYEMRKRFECLILLCLREDKYIPQLENIISAFCDAFTWVYPTHSNVYGNVTHFDHTVVDLFGSEIGCMLAEAYYIFGNKLCPDIKSRIKIAVYEKIIRHYEGREFWWEGESTNNWAGVCSGNIGLIYNYLFPERWQAVKDRLFRSLDKYMNSVVEDGTCTEGVGYWIYGFGNYIRFFDAYAELTGETPEVFNDPKVLRTVEYANQCVLTRDTFAPFADGGERRLAPRSGLTYCIKKVFGDKFTLAPLRPDIYGNVINTVYGLANFDYTNTPKQGFAYYPVGEVYLNKKKNYVFVSKGGHNKEMHNHNDVGCFELLVKDRRIISDPGVGEYVYDTFSDNRYKIEYFFTHAIAHSVPVVDGKYQKEGKEHHGKVLRATETDFEIDVSQAYEDVRYPVTLRYRLEDKSVTVEYETENQKLVPHFVSDYRPLRIGNTLWIKGVRMKYENTLLPVVNKIFYNDHNGKRTFNYVVDFHSTKEDKNKFVFKILI